MAKKDYNADYQNAETRALEMFTDEMIKKIESLGNDAKWEQPWLSNGATMSWPKNLSGRPYSGMNSFLLLMMCEKNKWNLPVFSTFNRLTALNLQKGKNGEDLPRVMVNKGEKSTPVFLVSYTCVNKDTKEKIAYEDFRQLDPKEKENYSVFPKTHVYNVFAVDQTNIKEARPELYAKLEEQNRVNPIKVQPGEKLAIPEFDAMIDRQRWICPINISEGDACYYSLSKQAITMVDKSRFRDGESFYSNLGHEMAHSTDLLLHRIKLDRFDERERAAEELKAELSAAVMCNHFGITKTLKKDSAVYMKSWLDSLKESPQFLKTILTDVKKMSGTIINRLDEVKLELSVEQSQNASSSQDVAKEQTPLKNLGTYDVPEWGLNYLANGDASGLEDFEVEMIDKFTDRFNNGYIMNVDWNNPNDFNQLPAFGETNPDALTNRGESAYCATKTFPVTFYDPILREDNAQEMDREQEQQEVEQGVKEQQEEKQEMVAKRGGMGR